MAIRYLSSAGVAKKLGVTRQRVFQMVQEGKLTPVVMVGHTPGFGEVDVQVLKANRER